MFREIKNLKITSVGHSIAKLPSTVNSRKNNGFILRTSGSVHYDFGNCTFTVNPGTLIFLPKGAAYTAKRISEEDCGYVSISFEADLKDAKPAIYTFDNFADADTFINHLPDLWKYGGQAEHYKCYAIFYELLTYLQNIESLNYSDKKKYTIIAPGVEYMKKHMYDANLRTDTLHTYCGISGTYFRKIFAANFGIAPQTYVQNKRLAHAKSMLDSGNDLSVSEVAASVGYADPFYFSRAFKKKYGIAPSLYSKDI